MHRLLFTLRALTALAVIVFIGNAGEVIPEFYLIALPAATTWFVIEWIRS